MKSKIYFFSILAGATAASLAFFGGLILLRTTAWNATKTENKVFTGLLLAVSALACISCFVHIIRERRVDGILAGILLVALGGYPLATTFHYLFIGPSYGGLIGGVGAAITFGTFLISLAATSAGAYIAYYSITSKDRNENHGAQPVATDNDPHDSFR